MVNKEPGLTQKQEKFVAEFLSNGEIASQAFIDAGYAATTENSIYASSSKLLRTAKVAAAIASRKAGSLAKKRKRSERLEVDQDWLVSELVATIEDARTDRQHNVVRNCIMDIGKVCGLIISKSELNASLTVDAQLTAYDSHALMEALQQAKRDTTAIEGNFREISAEDQP